MIARLNPRFEQRGGSRTGATTEVDVQRSSKLSEKYEKILSRADPAVKQLTERAKSLITEAMPEAVEVAWPRQNIVSYGVGPKKMSEHFCYIAVLKDRINLGFYYGAELPDPDRLLEGTGKLLRHIKIRTLSDLENPAVAGLIDRSTGYLPNL